jgi:hypothetical protein
MINKNEINEAIRTLINVFTKLEIEYFIGGSVASSLYGIARTTLDADIVAKIDKNIVKELENSLKNEYYIDTDMILDAIDHGSSFNLIHLSTMIKIDIFIYQDTQYNNETFLRKNLDSFPEEEDAIYFCSPEDIVLSKLNWYKQGNMISERQWNDILGVMKVRHNILDLNYLRKWALHLDLDKLLIKALQDAGIKYT